MMANLSIWLISHVALGYSQNVWFIRFASLLDRHHELHANPEVVYAA